MDINCAERKKGNATDGMEEGRGRKKKKGGDYLGQVALTVNIPMFFRANIFLPKIRVLT